MKFAKSSDAEVSASRQYVVDADGDFQIAKTFGGRSSMSGATLWPEWVQEGAVAIKPLAILREDALTGERLIAFSGGGHAVVRLYVADCLRVRQELEKWRKWRKFEPLEASIPAADEDAPPKRSRLPNHPAADRVWVADPEPAVSSDAEWLARAISFNEVRWADGARLTQHEVSRYASSLSCCWDEGSGAMRWTAVMPMWPFMATAIDKGRGPECWTLYEQQMAPVDCGLEDGFVEDGA